MVPWYYAVPIGKNLLANMVKDMCSEAGLEGKKTNHSLSVAGTTCLYEAGVPEKVIQQRTGHRCLQSFRHYDRISSDQEVAVSRIFSGEVDNYEPKSENKPDPRHSISKQESSLTAPFPGIRTVIVFSAGNVPPYLQSGLPGNASPLGYLSTYPPFPPPFPSTPYYPEFPPITSSYLVIEDDLQCTE